MYLLYLVVVMYSNACIGGSSTAANMANNISRFDLIFPATIAGLFGYVIGTPAGLSLARLLNLKSSHHAVHHQMKHMF